MCIICEALAAQTQAGPQATTVSDYTALLSGFSINGGMAKGAFVSFSFPASVPEYYYSSYPNGLNSFQAFNDAQQATTRTLLNAISAVTGLTFFEVAPGEGDMKFMQFDIMALNGSNPGGFAPYPEDGGESPFSSDVVVNKNFAFDVHVVLHEIGHALGLKHPFEGDLVLPSNLDNYAQTVMSYTPGGSPGTALGPLDIQALRALYGDETRKGTQSAGWNWDAATLTLTQTGTANGETLYGIGGRDVIDGGDGDDIIFGREGDDILTGGAGNDELRGGMGFDRLSGGDGDDRLFISITGPNAPRFMIDGGSGTDTLVVNTAYFRGTTLTLSAADSMVTGVESVTIDFSRNYYAVAPNFTITGSSGNDTITTQRGNDIIDGGAGNDVLNGHDGNDILIGGEGNDVLTGQGSLYGGAGDDIATIRAGIAQSTLFDGGEGNDRANITLVNGVTNANLAQLGLLGVTLVNVEYLTITGNSDANVIDARNTAFLSVSILSGGGNDTIYGNAGTNFVNGGAGNDMIYSGYTGTVMAGLQGGDGDDVIHAASGAEELFGGAGADRFVFQSAATSNFGARDRVSSFETGIDKIDLTGFQLFGIELITGSSNYLSGYTTAGRFSLMITGSVAMSDLLLATTPAGMTGTTGGDTLSGDAGVNFIDGGTGDDILYGLGGNDILVGGMGNDQLFGGTGDDIYYVDAQGDIVFENAGEGIDTVFASANYYLYANIENLTLEFGYSDQFGVGNDLANIITGNNMRNLLLGGAGDDVIRGQAGDDQLYGEAGIDTLYGDAGIDYLIGGAGNDVLDGGSESDGLYGEDGDDTLIGGSGFFSDILVGGAGNDILRGDSGLGEQDHLDGGAGDDAYYVDSYADLTYEVAGGGTDTVYATINGTGYYLYGHVENLVLGGDTPFGVGNDLANRLTGSAAGNWLLGGGGNDVLNGKAGNDVLFGEGGADTFVFERGTGTDTVGDFQVGVDKIDLTAFGFTSFAQVQAAIGDGAGASFISLGGGDVIVLNGVTKAALGAGDFILSAVASSAVVLAAEPAGDVTQPYPALGHAIGKDRFVTAFDYF